MFDTALKIMGYVGVAVLALALAAVTVAGFMHWRREEQDREQEKLEQAFQKARLKPWNE